MVKPDYIAKFYNLKNVRYLHSVLVHNRLHFADVSDFNDPFEMIPALYRPKFFKRTQPIASGGIAHKSKEIKNESKIIAEGIRKFAGKQQKKMKQYGVCCFTESCADIVMWSHYADNHRGVCLVFATNYQFFKAIKKVRYIQRRLKMPLLEKKNPVRLGEIMVSKLDLWSHEKEWRLFRKFRNRQYSFPKSALRKIIFGCMCPAEDRDLVIRLTNDGKLKYYEAKMSHDEFELEVVEFQP